MILQKLLMIHIYTIITTYDFIPMALSSPDLL